MSVDKQQIDQSIAALCREFPNCFVLFERRRQPLKIGISADQCSPRRSDRPQAVGLALRHYTGNLCRRKPAFCASISAATQPAPSWKPMQRAPQERSPPGQLHSRSASVRRQARACWYNRPRSRAISSSTGSASTLSVIFGLAYGGAMPLCAVLARESFGQAAMGTVFGAMTMVSSIGMAFGPWAGTYLPRLQQLYVALCRCLHRGNRRPSPLRRSRNRNCRWR